VWVLQTWKWVQCFDVLFKEPSGVRIRVRLVPGALERAG
jgi:hypothetical protein